MKRDDFLTTRRELVDPFVCEGGIRLVAVHEPVALTFEPDGHVYSVGDETVPSVTQILKKHTNVYQKYISVPEWILKRAADIGVTAHTAIEDWINTGSLLTTDDESANMYLDGFVEFLREHEFVPLFSEMMLYHPELWYAGTIDLVCVVDGVLTVCDIKTTNNLNRKAIELQLAGYEKLIGFWAEFDRVSDRVSDRIFDRAVIWLNKRGGFKYVRAEDDEAGRKFENILRAA